jgi:hypothetical protein
MIDMPPWQKYTFFELKAALKRTNESWDPWCAVGKVNCNENIRRKLKFVEREAKGCSAITRGAENWGHHSFEARRSSLPSPPSPRPACLDPNEAMAVQPAEAWLSHIGSALDFHTFVI